MVYVGVSDDKETWDLKVIHCRGGDMAIVCRAFQFEGFLCVKASPESK